jgi:YggT family protein
MMILARVIHYFFELCILMVLMQAILSYFVDPYNQIRLFIDRLVNPFLMPIRRVIRPVGMFDFSPLVLIILLQVLDSIIMYLLTSLL